MTCRNSRKFTNFKIGLLLTCLLVSSMGMDCLDSDIAKRFREVAGPGITEGFSSAVTDPDNAEAGFRDVGAAILEGLGGIFNPRTPSSQGDSR
ncbi:hypothetical protein B7486_00310 [cyanobacterium TDX16]|nr:hypothetical protein B7486_00310 [cyanobacterium TDX16]